MCCLGQARRGRIAVQQTQGRTTSARHESGAGSRLASAESIDCERFVAGSAALGVALLGGLMPLLYSTVTIEAGSVR